MGGQGEGGEGERKRSGKKDRACNSDPAKGRTKDPKQNLRPACKKRRGGGGGRKEGGGEEGETAATTASDAVARRPGAAQAGSEAPAAARDPPSMGEDTIY
ncbi:unnamed protein product [Prorocentrum cordatum]|uniref:Uncharacterized protein n=1 Tax=Prorocentrum cordatum TaxID=2364126 RepID=A0ABN9R352_9DINO|nr:unnamed protein product [Polarella glacialis]